MKDFDHAPSESGTPLLDAVLTEHGPIDILSRFFLVADALGRRIGFNIKVHSDFTKLVEINSRLQASWGPLVPSYHPAHSALSPDNGFWLSVHDQTDELVAVSAVRRLDVAHSMADEFTSLRFLYANPQAHLDMGTTCTVAGVAQSSATRIKGIVAYSGGHWTHPSSRRKGIVHILAHINRALALTRWNIDFVVGITRVDLAAKQVFSPYGYQHSDRFISIRKSYRGDFDTSMIWMDRNWLETELTAYVAEQASKITNVTEVEDTTTSPLLVNQGSSSRS